MNMNTLLLLAGSMASTTTNYRLLSPVMTMPKLSPRPGGNQRQKRKDRRRQWASGNRKAFAK